MAVHDGSLGFAAPRPSRPPTIIALLLLLALQPRLSASLAQAPARAPHASTASLPRVLSGAYNVVWTTPTVESDASAFRGGMPLGNGDVQAQPWADEAAGGVSLYISKGNAQHSDALPFKVALLSVALAPNPFLAGPFFNQTLDLAAATVLVSAGGTSLAAAAANISVWVDAGSNTVYVEISAAAPVALSVTLTPVRPTGYPSYTADWRCQATTSQPDVVVDPLPLGAGFPSPATLALFHRNEVDTDLAGGNAIANILAEEGIAPAVPLVPDFWKDLRFGLAVDAGGGAALVRASPTSLVSAAPATVFAVRASVLAAQVPADDAGWLASLAAQVAAQPAAGPPRAAHVAYWSAFWQRSWIDIDANSLPGPPQRPAAAAAAAATAAATDAASLPVAGASLWLSAARLQQANNSAVALWPDGSAAGTDLTQPNVTAQPRFVADALGAGSPGVVFDGVASFLSSANASVPASGSTMMAVFRDDGSATSCCSGIIFFGPRDAPAGLSTVSGGQGEGSVDDDDNNAQQGAPVLVMIDYSGSHTYGSLNVRGRLVHAAAVFSPGAAGSALHVDGCAQAAAPQGALASAGGVMVGSRNNEMQRFFRGVVGEVVVFPRALNASELGLMAAYFETTWPSLPAKKHCHAGGASPGLAISQAYAASRFMNAVQSRNVLPSTSPSPPATVIKFNGMAYTSNRPNVTSGPDIRHWGPDNWWQNTRLPYGPMLEAGDFAEQDVLFDYYLRHVPLLRARTELLFNVSADEAGFWEVETGTVFGSLSAVDYGICGGQGSPRPKDWPVWLGTNPYVLLDRYGDGPMAELGLMMLDRWRFDQDDGALLRRLPWAFGAVDFFAFIFPNRTASGEVVITPTQACETFWCPYPFTDARCVTNDAPTVATVTQLLARLLQLPARFSTAAQRAKWASLLAAMPPLPYDVASGLLLPAERLTGPSANSESVALYAVHPARLFSVAANLTRPGGCDLGRSVRTYWADPNAGGSPEGNNGWHQATMHAPLLGLRNETAALLLGRVAGAPLPGYRFPFFSGEDGMNDFPSVEQFSNLQAGAQLALLQAGEDAQSWDEPGSIVLLPGWPCASTRGALSALFCAHPKLTLGPQAGNNSRPAHASNPQPEPRRAGTSPSGSAPPSTPSLLSSGRTLRCSRSTSIRPRGARTSSSRQGADVYKSHYCTFPPPRAAQRARRARRARP